ncbi:AKT-interacting protein-like [Neodiprion fabricii]|uniref:AKT-interacting protein-like n=1 Tax=Neodiprion fabricii TaxID=2872261 RepID=UPI001ED8CEF0|nr:AKT-interacting protein-like [Neodiprion fabricii]
MIVTMSSRYTTTGIKGEGDVDDNFRQQGSLRKLLPSNSNGETQLAMSTRMIDRPPSTRSNREYAVFLQEYIILSEYNMMQKQDLKRIYVIPSANDSFLWFGVFFVRQGIYQGGVFRFTITLPPTFPDGGCPKVVFQPNVFHPLLKADTGELDTTWEFPEWKRNNRVWQLVQYIVKVFSKIDSKMPSINEEALMLFASNIESFQKKARASVTESLSQLYDPPSTDDPHYITFTPYDSSLHDGIKEEILKSKKEEENKVLGFSWVQPGSLQPFSKPETR